MDYRYQLRRSASRGSSVAFLKEVDAINLRRRDRAVSLVVDGLGADVVVTDPQALENARRVHPQLTYIASRDEALSGADAVIVVTEWDEYRRELSPEHAASLAAGRLIVDGRNCLDPAAWRAAGWEYRGMGRP